MADFSAEACKEAWVSYLMDTFRARATRVQGSYNQASLDMVNEISNPDELQDVIICDPLRSNTSLRLCFKLRNIIEKDSDPALDQRRTNLVLELRQFSAPQKVLTINIMSELLDEEIEKKCRIEFFDGEPPQGWTFFQKAALVAKYRLLDIYLPTKLYATVMYLQDAEGSIARSTVGFPSDSSSKEFLDIIGPVDKTTFTVHDQQIREAQKRRVKALLHNPTAAKITRLAHGVEKLCDVASEPTSCGDSTWKYVLSCPDDLEFIGNQSMPLRDEKDYQAMVKAALEPSEGLTLIRYWQLVVRETNNYIRLIEDKNEVGFLHDSEDFPTTSTTGVDGDALLPTMSLDLARCVDNLATIDAVPTSEGDLTGEASGLYESTARSPPPLADVEKKG